MQIPGGGGVRRNSTDTTDSEYESDSDELLSSAEGTCVLKKWNGEGGLSCSRS